MVAQWVALLPRRFRIPCSILTSVHSLCGGLVHVFSVFGWVSSKLPIGVNGALWCTGILSRVSSLALNPGICSISPATLTRLKWLEDEGEWRNKWISSLKKIHIFFFLFMFLVWSVYSVNQIGWPLPHFGPSLYLLNWFLIKDLTHIHKWLPLR